MKTGPKAKMAEQRFWEKVSIESDCWRWLASTQKKDRGYGQFIECAGRHEHGGERLAHRFSWKLHFGPIPSGMNVLHKCDNTICVNPEHLFLGTALDNTQDMIRKNRRVRKQKEKLDFAKAEEIRKLSSIGKTQREIAKIFLVSPGAIQAVVENRTWEKHASN